MSIIFKYAWLNAEPAPKLDFIRSANKHFRRLPYSGQVGQGYILHTVTADSIEADFVVRSVVEETFEDPVAGPITVKRHSIAVTHFILAARAPHLELQNPGKNANTLLKELSEKVLPEHSFERISFDFSKLLGKLRKRLGRIDVTGIETSPFYINGRTLVAAQFRSLYDVTRDTSEMLARYEHSIAALRATPKDRDGLRLEFTKAGKLVAAAPTAGELLDEVRNSVRQYFADDLV